MNNFETTVAVENGLRSFDIKTVQVNIGLRCNQSCMHCHLEASPLRTEMMEWRVMKQVTKVCKISGCTAGHGSSCAGSLA